MIVFNVQFLTLIGMPKTEADSLARQPCCDGLSVSYLFNFGGGGDRRAFEEARAARPTSLMLVGMNDGYGAAQGLGLAVRAICTMQPGARRPTTEEAAEIETLLAACAHPAAPRITELLRGTAQLTFETFASLVESGLQPGSRAKATMDRDAANAMVLDLALRAGKNFEIIPHVTWSAGPRHRSGAP